jgi:hypothetical protein
VEPVERYIGRQRVGKQVPGVYMHATIEELWEKYFLFGPCRVFIKKSSIENHQSSSGVPSEQLVES